MSCETHQNAIAAVAGSSSGIPKSASKFANYSGKILVPALVVSGGAALAGGIYGIKVAMKKIKEAREKEAAEKIQRARQRVATIKDPDRKQVAFDIQSRYIGAGIFREGLEEVLDDPEYTRLGRKTWLASGVNGSAIVDDLGDGTYVLRGIGISIGSEWELRNGLAAYSFRHPDLAKKAAAALAPKPQPEPEENEEQGTRFTKSVKAVERTADTTRQWVVDNQEEIMAVAGNGLKAAKLIGGLYLTASKHGGVQKMPVMTQLSYLHSAGNLVSSTYNTAKKAQAMKLEAAHIIEAIRSPEYAQAAAALQKQYNGVRVSQQSLEGLMQARSYPIIDGTYKVQGNLGLIYYDEARKDGRVTIQRVVPAPGKEIQLHRGLKILKETAREITQAAQKVSVEVG